MSLASDVQRKTWPTILAFGITQIIGWGVTFNLPGVIGTSIATSFQSSLDLVLLGPTVMLTAMAVVSWWSAPLFERFGTRILMSTGAIIIASGLLIMSVAPTMSVFLAAWLLFGIGGAISLSTAAQIAMAELHWDRARQSIGGMALVSGLSNTILWPLFARIDTRFGWQTVMVVGAVAMVIIYVPLVLTFGAHKPRKKAIARATVDVPAERLDPMRFALMAGSSALNGFVTWGFSLTLIPLLVQKGVDTGAAVTMASFLGIIAIAARGADMLSNWTPLQTAIVSTAGMASAFVLLFVGESVAMAVAFILVYGLASGVMGVVRATLPLTIFPPRAYAQASARLGLPLNLAFAAAPPLFALILDRSGTNTALGISLILSVIALVCLLVLARLVRRQSHLAETG